MAQYERVTAKQLTPGMVIRVANQPQGDPAEWRTFWKSVNTGRVNQLFDQDGHKIGTYGYPTKFEVQPPAEAPEARDYDFDGILDHFMGGAEQAWLRTTDGVEIVDGLAVWTNEMNLATVDFEATFAGLTPGVNTWDGWFATRTWQTWEGEQIPGGRPGPIMNGERL